MLRLSSLLFHVILLVLSTRWPEKYAKWQSVLIGPVACLCKAPIAFDTEGSKHMQMIAVIIYMFFYHFSSFLMNYRWIMTAIGQIFSVTLMLVFLWTYRGCCDIIVIAATFGCTYIVIFACHMCEKKLKTHFLHTCQIQTMNNELINLFNNLPEGIVIYNNETKTVSLVNSEFKRLFKL